MAKSYCFGADGICAWPASVRTIGKIPDWPPRHRPPYPDRVRTTNGGIFLAYFLGFLGMEPEGLGGSEGIGLRFHASGWRSGQNELVVFQSYLA
jgi:hypothetical protein